MEGNARSFQSGTIVSTLLESLGGGNSFGRKGAFRQPSGAGPGHLALAGKGFIVRNVKLRPLDAKPLFNGKAEWLEEVRGRQKRARSTFSVTEDGWLNVKNGPGDLQTVGQYDDFVLQLDCRTNGRYLNSGVFFRCLPGQYQMGYEAQIHNKFLDPPGKEYTLDVYNPTTHKRTGKKKERFLAADYGTGAIYRRMPARLQRAKDKEWFSITVVARRPASGDVGGRFAGGGLDGPSAAGGQRPAGLLFEKGADQLARPRPDHRSQLPKPSPCRVAPARRQEVRW